MLGQSQGSIWRRLMTLSQPKHFFTAIYGSVKDKQSTGKYYLADCTMVLEWTDTFSSTISI